MTIEQALQTATQALLVLDDASSRRLDAELLLSFVLGCDRSYFFAWPDKQLDQQQLAVFESLLDRRKKNEPIAYILGKKEFWSFDLTVNNHVLIPRPETECLVERVLELTDAKRPLVVLDIATGSSAIACALASERPAWKIIATDISLPALSVAKANIQRLNLSSINIINADLCCAFKDQSFSIIVSNPPYISANDDHLQQGDVVHEPNLALVSADNGFAHLRKIIETGFYKLRVGGLMLLEHGFQQGQQVRDLMLYYGYKNILTHKDLAGLERFTEGYR